MAQALAGPTPRRAVPSPPSAPRPTATSSTGLEPPDTARHRNPFREWIGALIRADVHGWINPGDPATAAEQAHRDATLTHTAIGVYAAMFAAAVIATAATGTHDVHACSALGPRASYRPAPRLAGAVCHA